MLASNGGNYSSTYEHCAVPESRFWKLQNIPTDEQKTASLFEMEMEMGAAFQSGRKPLGRAWIMSADDCSHAISSVQCEVLGTSFLCKTLPSRKVSSTLCLNLVSVARGRIVCV